MKIAYNLTLMMVFVIIMQSCSGNDDFLSEPDEEVNETVSIYNKDKFFKGYTLYAPIASKNIYLLNMEGFVVKKWTSNHNGIANYLTPSGELIRSFDVPNPNFLFGGRTGGIEKFDFEGNLIWSWVYSTEDYSLHHDLAILPNGNILASVWDRKNEQEAIDNGRNPALLTNNEIWPERIIEVKPVGSTQADIVWEWNIWDHLVQDFDASKLNYGSVSENPQLVDINYTIGDANFNHVNSLFYIEEFDQIVFSSRRFNELMIIDHSTTTQQAATSSGGNYNKGGNLLYRWGNPEAYKTGTVEDKKLFGQHDVSYIGNLPNNGNGNFLNFNNDRFDLMSSVDEINIPQQADGTYNLIPNTANLPLDFAWSYSSPDIYAPRVSGAQRLSNGNTLITCGTEGTLYEIDSNSELVWKYTFPLDQDVFKSFRYPVDYPIFNNTELPILNIIID